MMSSPKSVFAHANHIETYSTIMEGQGEAVSKTFVDGHGRPRLSVSDLPNAPVGIYSAVITEYDILGRVKRQTTPTEVNSLFQPVGDDAPNMPGRSADGWLWTGAEYDWKGRVTKSINTDGTFKTISYTGCGCAGGEITTIQSEEVPRDDLPNVQARRMQKIYSDPFGKTYKSETYNWDGTTVYSTAVTTFDALDQVTNVKQYAGGTSETFQETILEYDGHGRLKRQHAPIQDAFNDIKNYKPTNDWQGGFYYTTTGKPNYTYFRIEFPYISPAVLIHELLHHLYYGHDDMAIVAYSLIEGNKDVLMKLKNTNTPDPPKTPGTTGSDYYNATLFNNITAILCGGD